jgi:hypothetical protein
LGPEEIDRVFRKWLRRIPLPVRREDREAGYDWDLSTWQMEVSLTQILQERDLIEMGTGAETRLRCRFWHSASTTQEPVQE